MNVVALIQGLAITRIVELDILVTNYLINDRVLHSKGFFEKSRSRESRPARKFKSGNLFVGQVELKNTLTSDLTAIRALIWASR